MYYIKLISKNPSDRLVSRPGRMPISPQRHSFFSSC